jgi:hypothetical protein
MTTRSSQPWQLRCTKVHVGGATAHDPMDNDVPMSDGATFRADTDALLGSFIV